MSKPRVQDPKPAPKAEDSSPPDRRAIRDAKRFKKETEALFRKHAKKLTPEQRERVEGAIRGVDEALEAAKTGSKRQLASAVKDLDQVVEDVLGFAKKSGTREFLESITVAILIAAVLRAFVIEAFKIPSGSMIPTLEVGDHIFVNKFIYGLRIPLTNAWLIEWGSPERGDVIVFRYPLDTSKDYIKRVVAVAGDKVHVEQRDVFVNGVKLERDPPTTYSYWEDAEPGGEVLFPGMKRAYAFSEKSLSEPPKRYTVLYNAEEHIDRAPFPRSEEDPKGLECHQTQPNGRGECVVLPGYVFVMGDNRDNSSDGRQWGGVPISYVKGKAMFVWWSRGERSGIRWERLFQGIE